MNGIKKWLIAGLPIVLIGAALLSSIPEMRRYLRIKRM